MSTTLFTNGVTLTDAAWFNDVDTNTYPLTAIAGTNTITATGPSSLIAYTAGHVLKFIPANNNTGALTINVSSIGAKNILINGASCKGGELVAGVPTLIYYDGTNFNILNPANMRLAFRVFAKTSAYVISNADNGVTFSLGGSSFYTVTINAASGFDSNFIVQLYNADTLRCKDIAINGLATLRLYPGQSVRVFNDNSVWRMDTQKTRWTANNTINLYVDNTLGNDDNDGMAAGSGNAFKTISAALAKIYNDFDFQNINHPIINCADGAYTDNLIVFGTFVDNVEPIIIGNVATPANCTWTVAGGQTAVSARDLGICTVKGFKFISSGSGSNFLTASQFGVVDFQNCDFGVCANGYHLLAQTLGSINCLSDYTISGNAGVHAGVLGNGSMTFQGGSTVSMPNALTVTYFYQVQGPGMIDSGAITYTGAGSGAGTTGSSYNVTLNGVLGRGGSTVPGGAGGTSTGGQVV